MKNFLMGVMTTVLCIVAIGANYQVAPKTTYEYKPELIGEITFQNHPKDKSRGILWKEIFPAGWKIAHIYNYFEEDALRIFFIPEKVIRNGPQEVFEYQLRTMHSERSQFSPKPPDVVKLEKEGWRLIRAIPYTNPDGLLFGGVPANDPWEEVFLLFERLKP
jgi:hypothetical protein